MRNKHMSLQNTIYPQRGDDQLNFAQNLIYLFLIYLALSKNVLLQDQPTD